MLGQELVRIFSKQYEVAAWDKQEIDITKIIDYRLSIIDLHPDLIINAAAYNDVDGAEKDPELANQINGYAVGNLAAIASDLRIPIVHYSTDYVFYGERKAGYKEEDVPNPISAYGGSKFLGEQALQKSTDKFYLIRLSRLFGSTSPGLRPPSPGLERGRGEVETIRKKSFVSLMLELGKTKKEIEVVDEELSSPTYAPDLAKQTFEIVGKKLPFGIYHATNQGACTWYEFAREIFNIVRIDAKLIPVRADRFSRPAKRPKFSILLNAKLPPMRSWQKALAEYLNFTNN